MTHPKKDPIAKERPQEFLYLHHADQLSQKPDLTTRRVHC